MSGSWQRLDVPPLAARAKRGEQCALFSHPVLSSGAVAGAAGPGSGSGAVSRPGECDTAFSRVEHIDLGGGAWVEFHEGWAQAPDALFALLRNETRWQAHSRIMYERRVAVPRLTGSPDPRSASQRALRPLALALSRRYGRELYEVSFAFYRDGNDSVAMHGDKLGAAVDDSIVAIVSLGAPRRFSMKRGPVACSPPLARAIGRAARFWAGPDRLEFRPGPGDLVVMGGSCQRDWLHGVPKAARAGERMAVMFR